MEALLHHSAVPIQLLVQTTDLLLKPGFGRLSSVLLPTPVALETGSVYVTPGSGYGKYEKLTARPDLPCSCHREQE